MSLFSAFGLGGFDEDPFMSSRNIFGQMDHMMGSMMRNPFGGDPFFQGSPLNAIMAPRPTRRAETRDPFAMMPFGGMNNMMMSAMDNMAREGSCHSFSSSSVMTMTTGPDGRPQVYQATSSTRAAPGGVRETKNTVSDSRTGLRKMAIGHHIEDRSHVIEKESKDGETEERQEFVNLDETEAPEFDSEFRRLAQRTYGQGAIEHRPRHSRAAATAAGHRSTYLPALPSSSSYRRRARPMLALTSGSRFTEEEIISDSEDIIVGDEEPKKVNQEKNLRLESKSKKKSRKRKAPIKASSDDLEENSSDDIHCLGEKAVNGRKQISKKKRKSSQ